jgi:hypothetical protein
MGISLSLLNNSNCLFKLQEYKYVVFVNFCLRILLCFNLIIDVAF